MRQDGTAGILVWIQNPNGLVQFLPDELDRLQQVRVIGNDDCDIEAIQMGIVQQMGRQIDIRTLFFRLDDLDVRASRIG